MSRIQYILIAWVMPAIATCAFVLIVLAMAGAAERVI
jgi:hypothetical protein